MRFVYDKAVNAAWQGGLNLLGGSLKAMLVDNTLYTASQASDQHLSDIPSGARITSGITLTSVTLTGRVLNADPITFPLVPIGNDATTVVLYIDSGSPSTSPLILLDEDAAGLPAVLNGEDVIVTPDTGARKIAAL
jgi:hypothetical protein